MNFEWIGKSRSARRSDSDVSITINTGRGRKVTAFRFRNNSILSITKTGYVEFAVCKDRIYFRESNKRNGYSANMKPEEKSCGFRTAHVFKNFVGDYVLRWDAKENLYYIGLETQIK